MPVKRYSTDELIAGIRKRDDAVLEYIYRKSYEPVMRFVLNNTGSGEDAKDLFQEAMIVVFQNIRKDPEFKISCSLQTYIYSIARLIWIKHLNRLKYNRARINENLEFIDFVEPEPFNNYDQEFALYQRVFLELPEDCRKIIHLSNQGMSHREIAEELGFKSEKYIKKRKHFCKEYLINLIRKHPDFNTEL
jgi:RNA polymerase sigma factor (sigma-70 family)